MPKLHGKMGKKHQQWEVNNPLSVTDSSSKQKKLARTYIAHSSNTTNSLKQMEHIEKIQLI